MGILPPRKASTAGIASDSFPQNIDTATSVTAVPNVMSG